MSDVVASESSGDMAVARRTLSGEEAEHQMTVALRPGQTTRGSCVGKRDVDVVEILLHLHVAVAIRRRMRLLRASSILRLGRGRHGGNNNKS